VAFVDQTSVTQATRIISDHSEISYRSTLDFFEERANKAPRPDASNVVLYQDNNPALADARDIYERAEIAPKLGLHSEMHCLDVGCGTARWAPSLLPKVASYTGIDFSPGLVALAKERIASDFPHATTQLHVMNANQLSSNALGNPQPFDLIVAGGVFMYLNDEDAKRLALSIADLSAPQATVYIREPIALSDRLTLQDHYSDDLSQVYSAIYRTQDEYDALFEDALGAAGFSTKETAAMYPESLSTQATTRATYWLVTR
jgi:cyclopropane fatty-acyl-phospholipid synthase-like methyltransferase